MRKRLISLCLTLCLALSLLPTAAFAASEDIPIDEQHFPDQAFRAWLMQESTLNGIGSDGILTSEEIMTVKELTLEDENGALTQWGAFVGEFGGDFTGLAYFTALEKVYLSFANQWPALPDSLKSIVLWCCPLEEITSLPRGLERLHIEECDYLAKLPEIPQTLEYLYIRLTSLTSLPPLPSTLKTLTIDFDYEPEYTDTPTTPPSFTDVPSDAYYSDAVAWAVSKGITTGTGGGQFSPNASCTRAEMVTFLWRAAGSPAPSGGGRFTDVPSDAYYHDAVLWAAQQGITTGTGAGIFDPAAIVTRAQTVTFLYRFAGSPDISGGSAFGDVASGTYYTDAVSWAVSNGITNGNGPNSFGPAADCSRGQIVTFLFRHMAE